MHSLFAALQPERQVLAIFTFYCVTHALRPELDLTVTRPIRFGIPVTGARDQILLTRKTNPIQPPS